jgi:hypothetical protein
MEMTIIYGDFESYYDKEYTLKKITPYEYILDPRWETIGCGIAIGYGAPSFFPGDTVADLLREYPRPWAFVSYNALFDASILSFRYGIHPDLLIDAMGIVRAVSLHGIRNGRVSLENVCKHLLLPPKGDTVLKVSGMRRADIEAQPKLWREFVTYCCNDVESCRTITKTLGQLFPRSELWVMDAILKMCTKPKFYGDLTHMHAHLANVLAEKNALLSRVGLTRADLLSADKFAEALKKLGVEPPTKLSLATGKPIWAFAKTDEDFRALEEHENSDVQALVAARIGVKSTLEERRTQRFIGMAEAAERAFGIPWMPIALGYGKAHTHRFGGEWKVNFQNLPSRKNTKLRESIVAPPGYKVMDIDASQIECRLVAWLAGEDELLQEFAKGTDVYSWFGSDMFKKPINKKTHPIERFISKENVLGLGFQMGPDKLLYHLTNKAADHGLDIQFTHGQCEIWVNFYRTKFKKIRKLWWTTERILDQMMLYKPMSFRLGPSHTEGTDLVLPNGLRLYYDNLRTRNYRKVFDWGREVKEIYGGKFTENHVQALDRVHVMEAAQRIDNKLKDMGLDIELAHQMHDGLIYVVMDELVPTLGVIAYEEMRTPAAWGAGLPLDAEVKVGQSYGTMKEISIEELRSQI